MQKNTKIIYTTLLIPLLNIFLILFIDYIDCKYISSLLSNKFYENILLDILQTPIVAAGIVIYTYQFIKHWNRKYFNFIHVTNIILWCCLWFATYIKSTYTIYLMFSLKYYLLWLSTLVIIETLFMHNKRKAKA